MTIEGALGCERSGRGVGGGRGKGRGDGARKILSTKEDVDQARELKIGARGGREELLWHHCSCTTTVIFSELSSCIIQQVLCVYLCNSLKTAH